MLLSISLLAALVGVGFAGAAALQPDSGVDGSPGAFLALLGALGVALVLGLLVSGRLPARWWGLFAVIAAIGTILTALAAWFLMQDALLAAMAVSLLALLAGSATAQRRAIT